MLFDGESFKSRHGLHSFLLLLGDRSLLRSKCETYLISSGQLFKDLSDFRDFSILLYYTVFVLIFK